MVRIAVFVSGGGTNLQALLDAQARGELGGGEIVHIISSSKRAYALERAARAGVPWSVFPANGLRPEEHSAQIDEFLSSEVRPDLIVLAGYLKILSREFCEKYSGRIINIHPSLLPSFCGSGMYGLHVHEAVLSRGVKVTGATVHFVDDVVDGGPIIAQKAVSVKEGDTPEILQKRVMDEAEHKMLAPAVALFCQGRLSIENGIVHISPDVKNK